MTIPVYTFGLQVTLFRLVDRKNGIAALNRTAFWAEGRSGVYSQ